MQPTLSIVQRNPKVRALEQLSLSEIRSLPPQATVFFQAVGGLEPHGENYPIGCDILEALETIDFLTSVDISESPDQELKSMVPVVGYPIEFSPQLHLKKLAPQLNAIAFKQIILNRAELLSKLGFKKCIWVTGTRTPRHLGILHEALEIAKRKFHTDHLLMGYHEKSSATENASLLYPATQSHGHVHEESLLQRLRMNLPAIHSSSTKAAVEFSLKKWWFNETPLSWNNIARETSAEDQKILLHKERRFLMLLLKDFLKEPRQVSHLAPPGALYPWNRSYLKSYLIGVVTAVLWAFIVSWALMDLIP